MKIIKLYDEENEEVYLYEVKEKQVDRVVRMVDSLIGKFYNNWEYYSINYGGLIDFVECKMKKANIYFETADVISINF